MGLVEQVICSPDLAQETIDHILKYNKLTTNHDIALVLQQTKEYYDINPLNYLLSDNQYYTMIRAALEDSYDPAVRQYIKGHIAQQGKHAISFAHHPFMERDMFEDFFGQPYKPLVIESTARDKLRSDVPQKEALIGTSFVFTTQDIDRLYFTFSTAGFYRNKGEKDIYMRFHKTQFANAKRDGFDSIQEYCKYHRPEDNFISLCKLDPNEII